MSNLLSDLIVYIGVAIGCVCAFIVTVLLFILGIILQTLPIILVIGVIFLFLRLFGVI